MKSKFFMAMLSMLVGFGGTVTVVSAPSVADEGPIVEVIERCTSPEDECEAPAVEENLYEEEVLVQD